MPYPLPPEVEEGIDRIVAELPPLTDAELDDLTDALARIRIRGGQDRDQ